MFGVCLLISLIYGLPHIIIPLTLSSEQQYTPFAINGVSALTYDESYIYAAQANYTSIRWKPAYDTDIYEYRDVPAVFPSVPYFLLAAMTHLTGGIDKTFIVSDFVFPPLAFFLVYALVSSCTLNPGVGLLAGLCTVVVSFGPRNFLEVLPDILRTGWSSANQPLEYSRMLHPQLSFTVFALAIYLLWWAMNRSSVILQVASGLAGGLLFYVYAYYWPVWLGACFLLCLSRSLRHSNGHRRLWLSFAVAVCTSVFFWRNYLEARRFPNYAWRSARFGMEFGHTPSLPKLTFTAVYIGIFLSFLAIGHLLSGARPSPVDLTHRSRVRLFFGALFIAACIALNIEVITGVNVESLEHYPNRFFQPFLVMACFVFLGPPTLAVMSSIRLRYPRLPRLAIVAGLVLLTGLATLRQTVVAINTAPRHVYDEEKKSLYAWLNRNTSVDSVVLLPVSDLSYLLPVYTHNCQWIPNGTRTTASNAEILDRFLIGAKLTGENDQWVRTALAQSTREGNQPLGHTYIYYLFQGNYNSPDRRLGDDAIQIAIEKYRKMDLSLELPRFRLDYVYARGSAWPRVVPGYKFSELYRNPYGGIFGVERISSAGQTFSSPVAVSRAFDAPAK